MPNGHDGASRHPLAGLVFVTSCGREGSSEPGHANNRAAGDAASCVQAYAPDTLVLRSFWTMRSRGLADSRSPGRKRRHCLVEAGLFETA